jgi:hypothetical protein
MVIRILWRLTGKLLPPLDDELAAPERIFRTLFRRRSLLVHRQSAHTHLAYLLAAPDNERRLSTSYRLG